MNKLLLNPDIEKYIKDNRFKSEIARAIQQEDRIAYFVQTQLQDAVYSNSTASIDGVWEADNQFLAWIRSWMRKENFVAYMKYYRHPLPTTTLIQDDILPELSKVLEAQNQYFNYNFSSTARENDATAFLKENYSTYYRDVIFEALINNHNSIVVTDYVKTSDPYRLMINIRDVVAISPDTDKDIKEIVFKGLNQEGEDRLYYYTDKFYSVWKIAPEDKQEDGKKYIRESYNTHTLKKCPADFISQKALNSKLFVVRKSLFSNFIEKMENYVNYHVMQKMFIPHGALPVITHYKQNKGRCKPSQSKFADGTYCNDGWLANSNGILGSRDAKIPCPICNKPTIITAGSIVRMAVPKFGKNGEKPFDLNANFVKFHYAPVPLQKWLEEFVGIKREEIRYEIVGRVTEKENSQAKNVEQVRAGNRILENTLLYFSNQLSSLRHILDSKTLTIKFGDAYRGMVGTFGTEWYLETEKQLREMLKLAADPIQKDNLKVRINFAVYKNNADLLARNDILYKLLPYMTLTDSELMTNKEKINKLDFELRINFNYYIDAFEAEYADISIFINKFFSEGIAMSDRLNVVKTLLYKMAEVRAIENESKQEIKS